MSRGAFFGGSRVAFFGGSFDPPHHGHLAVARAAREALALDTVLFAPVGAQPLKPHGATAGFDDRLAMTHLAIAGERGFAVSDIDAPRRAAEAAHAAPSDTATNTRNHAPDHTPNYTVDTLRALRAELPPGIALFCLVGGDSFFSLRRWHRAAELPFLAPLIVAARPGQPMEQLQAAVPAGLTLRLLQTEQKNGIELSTFSVADASGRCAPFYLLPRLDIEISASAIRTEIANPDSGRSAERRLLPEAVADYIRARHLYR